MTPHCNEIKGKRILKHFVYISTTKQLYQLSIGDKINRFKMVCTFQLLLICVFFLKTCSLIICQTNLINNKPVLQRRYQTVIFAESDGLNEKPKGFGRPKIVASSKEIIADASTSIETDGAVQKIPEMKTPRQRMIEELDSKIKTLQEEEQLLASDPSVGAVPEIVANRMIGRIVRIFPPSVRADRHLIFCSFFHLGCLFRHSCFWGLVDIRWSFFLF